MTTRPWTWTPPVTPDSWPPSAAETGACLRHYPSLVILAICFQYQGFDGCGNQERGRAAAGQSMDALTLAYLLTS